MWLRAPRHNGASDQMVFTRPSEILTQASNTEHWTRSKLLGQAGQWRNVSDWQFTRSDLWEESWDTEISASNLPRILSEEWEKSCPDRDTIWFDLCTGAGWRPAKGDSDLCPAPVYYTGLTVSKQMTPRHFREMLMLCIVCIPEIDRKRLWLRL